MRCRLIGIFIVASLVIVSCKDKGTSPVPDFTFMFDFSESDEGWIAGFADYPVGEEEFYELESERSVLPEPLDQNTFSMKIAGNNHSDDLFMFLKKKITGMEPNTVYDVTLDVEIASQYPASSIGVGGSPGSSVFVKVGATPTEPLPVVDGDYYRMNIDKGSQSDEGQDMVMVGNIGIAGEDFVYTLIRRDNENRPVRAQSDENGDLWLVVGTDSGFESTTTIYYNTIEANLFKVE